MSTQTPSHTERAAAPGTPAAPAQPAPAAEPRPENEFDYLFRESYRASRRRRLVRSLRRRWWLFLLALALFGGAATAAYVFYLRPASGPQAVSEPSTRALPGFRIDYPEGWRPLSKQELASQPGRPLAVIRRTDGAAFVVVTRSGGRLANGFQQTAEDLKRQLDGRIPDFVARSAKTIQIRAGKALYVSFIRRQKGTVNSVVVVPAGNATYTLNTVSRGGNDEAARQVAQMIVSFDTT